MWILFACLSAFFAGLTAIFSKCGIKNTNSNVATAIRTSIVLALAWIVVLITGEVSAITAVSAKSWIFLALSGLATGCSWICYFKALSLGEVSKVSVVDKSSVVLSVLLAIAIFPTERTNWWIKLICITAIGVGTYLMIDIKHDAQEKTSIMWLVFAFMSALFAAATSILAKVGISGVPSNLATAIRTIVVLVVAWIIVFAKRETHFVKQIPQKDLLFLVLSGFATAASWLCYYYAIENGQVSVVVPIDKLSILVTVAFSVVFLKEKLTVRAWIGLAVLVAGTICMAIFA